MEAIHEGEKNKQFAFFAVGMQGANMDILRQISVRQPLPLQGLNFTSLFQWLSNSMSSVSRSSLDAEIALETPSGWVRYNELEVFLFIYKRYLSYCLKHSKTG